MRFGFPHPGQIGAPSAGPWRWDIRLPGLGPGLKWEPWLGVEEVGMLTAQDRVRAQPGSAGPGRRQAGPRVLAARGGRLHGRVERGVLEGLAPGELGRGKGVLELERGDLTAQSAGAQVPGVHLECEGRAGSRSPPLPQENLWCCPGFLSWRPWLDLAPSPGLFQHQKSHLG